MQLLLKANVKIKKYNISSPIPRKKLSLAWQNSTNPRLLLRLVVGMLLSTSYVAISASELALNNENITNTSYNNLITKQTFDDADKELSDEQIWCDTSQPKITFKPQTIFDVNEEGFTFLHRWANAIHIDTKIVTLENEATFFINKCTKTFADRAELERHLRSRRFLRDAEVSTDEDIRNITITTWDNWSLMPTISFGRKGGMNTYSFGIKERNLLGLGIDTEIESYRNTQRSGYKLHAIIPLFQKQNTSVKLSFADNDDGQQRSLFLHKIFASFQKE